MHFKRIELNGFKSFADPVTIEFTDGITCIVGPNGSGKSNISDAIRWVLGEQSPKMLRGGKMEEVIFAGTQNRKPKGMAEVTLVIDNSDHELPIEFEEVGITRRMYRSGESEYMINKTPCRLRDIRDLIMDTGIGVEGYSIIGQGKISDIIDNKMDSRREIFEEAAGIVKYRTKKGEAERKLAGASDNLSRVNDIIHEIEGRIGTLKTDSEKAVEYLDIKDKYRKVEINVILKNIEQAEEKSDAVTTEVAELDNAIEETRAAREAIDEKLKLAREHSEAVEEKLDNLRSDLIAKNEELHFISSRSELNEERKASLEREKERLTNELATIEEKLSRENANALAAKDTGAAVEEEMNAAAALVSEKHNIVALFETKIAESEELRIKYNRMVARAHLLEELEKSYEGYNGSVRFMMSQNLNGIVGVLGDLLIVPKGCEVAVETVLGGKLQNIVCEDDDVAKKAIAILKQNQAGRLTFLPVKTLRPQKAYDTAEIKDASGFMGLASEMINCKGGYSSVVDYVLNRVVICDKLENAIAMTKAYPGPYKVVTLEGEVINAAGAITGGSLKNNVGNILSRRAELDQLTKDIEVAAKEVEELDSLHEKLAEAREAETAARLAESNALVRAQGSKDIEARVLQSLKDLEADKNAALKGLDNVEIQKSEIIAFADTAASAKADKEAERDAIQKEIEDTTASRKAEFEESNKLEADRVDLESKLYDIQSKRHEADVRMARFETQTESLKEKLWDEFEISFAEAQDLADPEFVFSRALKESREYRARLRELGDVNVGAIEEYKQVSERYEFLTTQREDINKAISELTAVIADMDNTIKVKFKESFEAVCDNFEGIFTELFNGGHARLTMEDPENPLETSIEIEAQPPGKKLQNMKLLSGGEKTMTAIALMFAVLKAKPTPFCILDEVEAALDEANIDRFAEYLSQFNNTQFALITHQKATMEYADALYGITMPEHGITQVLSLRLGDDFEI
ncbi:MAG: AAA family ATPase [Bacillota bacterium]|nr:AAA family ATPase [Bacillota bacterium]